MPTTEEPLRNDGKRHARAAGLHYGTGQGPGITRKAQGRGAYYVNARGKRVRDAKTLARIRALVIPPAWTQVWIAPRADDHLQATGRDARGRKQYRYHARWREARDSTKFANLIAFARVLPRIRKRVSRDLRRKGLPREKVLAAIVRLLEVSLIRVGNDEYARQNNSFGLTTIRDRHATIKGATLSFRFRGKSGVTHEVDLHSPQLARIVKHCQDLPGQELFQYLDKDQQVCDVGSADVNEYLRQISGEDITAKAFRTWAGTALAAKALQEVESFDTQAAAKRNITRAIERVAARLGNTTAVCRKCYVHPAIVEAYLDRELATTIQRKAARELRGRLEQLSPEEAAVLALLQQRMKREAAQPRRSRPSLGREPRPAMKRRVA